MTTKENCLFLKDKFFENNKSHFDDNGDQYSNLNLNQNQKYLNFSPIQSNSKLNNDKFSATFKSSDSTVSDNREDKRKLQTWNKLSDSCLTTLSLKDKIEGVKKEWKKNDSLNSTKNSTLSLHISAHESSTEAIVSDKCHDKKNFAEKRGNTNQIVTASAFVVQNPFEFQRQQNDKVSEPEMSQFGASQRLFNPNRASNNGQHMFNRNLPQSFTEFGNRNRESTSMSRFNDFVSESQPKRIKIDETLNVQPRKSCMKPSASFSSRSSSYNTYTIENDEELLDSEDEEKYESRGYDEYENEEEQSSRSRSIDVEEEVYEDKYEHDEEKYKPQIIQKLLAKQPAKSILKPAAANESNIYYTSTSESRATSKSLSDSEPEQPEENTSRIDEKFVIRENGKIVADSTAIFTPTVNLTYEQLKAMENRREELGFLFPPFTGTRQDASARYKDIKKIADQNAKMYWDGSEAQQRTLSFSATRKRVNRDNIKRMYSKANYENSLKKQQPKRKR